MWMWQNFDFSPTISRGSGRYSRTRGYDLCFQKIPRSNAEAAELRAVEFQHAILRTLADDHSDVRSARHDPHPADLPERHAGPEWGRHAVGEGHISTWWMGDVNMTTSIVNVTSKKYSSFYFSLLMHEHEV